MLSCSSAVDAVDEGHGRGVSVDAVVTPMVSAGSNISVAGGAASPRLACVRMPAMIHEAAYMMIGLKRAEYSKL